MTTEISARDKKLLFYLAVVGIIAIAYFFVARPLLDKVESYNNEANNLQMEVNSLLSIYNGQEAYTSKIAAEQIRVNEALEKFPSVLTQEKTIMMLSDIENNTGAWISRVSFSEEELLSGDENSAEGEKQPEEGAENIDSGSLRKVQQKLSLDYYCKYGDFKRFVEYISNYDNRLFISSLTGTYSPDVNEVSGTMIVSQYAIYGTGKEYVAPDLSDVNMGTENIFTTLGGTIDSSSLIEEDTSGGTDSMFMNVNSAALGDDVIVAGKAGDANGETYVKSSANEKSTVNIEINGESGQYSATYSIGDSENSCTISSGSDIVLSIVCTPRSDDSDNVSADLVVTNNTDKKVVIEVLGDDESNPRVSLKERNGDVEIK